MLCFHHVMMYLLYDLMSLVSEDDTNENGGWKVLTIHLHINITSILVSAKITW